MHIRTAAVLGAGTMGAQIAAHLANAGIPSLLLDVTRQVARDGLERARGLRPDPFFTPDASRLVRTGGFDEDLASIAGCDWIIEAVIERLDAKRALLDRVEPHRAAGAIVSSNTSGIPLSAIAEGRSAPFRRHWLGTHFFNPPRYLPLLELIPTADTDPAVTAALAAFADRHLGKGVVIAKDTPNFIANHVGLHGVMQVFRALESGEYTIEEIDAITGPAIGRPKSATFRTMDIAGIDVLAHVTNNLAERLTTDEDRRAFTLPQLVKDLVARGWVGAKSGQGFYKKDASGEILTLDPSTMEYRPKASARLPSLEAARSIEDVGQRIRALFTGEDKVGRFLRDTFCASLVYTARVAPAIAHSIDDVDRAMRWGFGWELGPFETMDAIGLPAIVSSCRIHDVPPLLAEALQRRGFRTPASADTYARVPPVGPGLLILRSAREQSRVMKRNAGASLIDLGDGVLCVEFHSKMNAIGGDTIQMLQAGVKEAAAGFRALVVGNDAVNFSAGANLMLLLLEAQEGNWDEVDLMVRAFQSATMALKHADVPVVVAPAGLTLGGGCEIALHADRVQAAAETYMGLVEVGVGLIPAGGGTKELLARAMDDAVAGVEALPLVQRVFETIGFAKVSASGPDARRIGYLRDVDAVSMNRERLIDEARAVALARAESYVAPQPRTAIRVGGPDLQAALKLGVHLAWRAGRISDHDARIGRKLAWILGGGSVPHATTLTEQQLLDLEREAFLSLCGEPRTQERIAHTLKTGKTLRN
ncbi:MAG TPA: 3-hydroxyacyl-CoA dehydrogenase NAD-binding domain-containing protein [Vicinamibacterales bacterium]|nr:3-hydroxyacyl-CoA dehydrogenase NAD-binding domain-containing protein [Vicinamibacterales bacterium]